MPKTFRSRKDGSHYPITSRRRYFHTSVSSNIDPWQKRRMDMQQSHEDKETGTKCENCGTVTKLEGRGGLRAGMCKKCDYVVTVWGSYPRFKKEDKSMQQSIFFPPKYKGAAREIEISSPAKARESISWLNKEWSSAKTNVKKQRLRRFANLAANRAAIIADNQRVSDEQRREAVIVSNMYREWHNSHEVRQ